MFHVEQAWMEALRDGAAELQIPLTPSQVGQFQQYLSELLSWNERVNLTAITEPVAIAIKHFVDSMMGLRVLQEGPLLDIGSGAGFPALPIKVVDPGRETILLEPSHKKSAFLHHLVGTLGLRGTRIVSRRLDQFAQDQAGATFANITTRALDLTPFLPLLPALLASSGRLILYRAQPLGPRHPFDEYFRVLDELRYSLPHGFGERTLTVMQPV